MSSSISSSNRRRRTLSGIAIGVALLLALEAAVRVGWLNRTYTSRRSLLRHPTLYSTLTRLEAFDRLDPAANVIILGSSRAMYGINTARLESLLQPTCPEVRIMNLGLFAGTPTVHKAVWYEDQRAFRAVKTLVVELPFFALNSRHNALYAMEARGARNVALGDVPRPPETTKGGRLLGRVWWTYRDRWLLRQVVENAMFPAPALGTEAEEQIALVLAQRGHKMTNNVYEPVDVVDDVWRRRGAYKDYELDGAELRALQHLLHIWQQRGVRVLVVRLPMPPAMETSIRTTYGPAFAAWGTAVDAATEQYGATFVDLGDTMPSAENRWFADPSHVNVEGAKYLTARLAALLLDGATCAQTGAPER